MVNWRNTDRNGTPIGLSDMLTTLNNQLKANGKNLVGHQIWCNDTRQMAMDLKAAGLSYSEIARGLSGITRGSIASIIHNRLRNQERKIVDRPWTDDESLMALSLRSHDQVLALARRLRRTVDDINHHVADIERELEESEA